MHDLIKDVNTRKTVSIRILKKKSGEHFICEINTFLRDLDRYFHNRYAKRESKYGDSNEFMEFRSLGRGMKGRAIINDGSSHVVHLVSERPQIKF